jgi:NAD(P)-dependent dehydrogenase (short-subunit alcohol dehydrogenase family)
MGIPDGGVVITGSGGVGFAYAGRFMDRGCDVVICDVPRLQERQLPRWEKRRRISYEMRRFRLQGGGKAIPFTTSSVLLDTGSTMLVIAAAEDGSRMCLSVR